MRVETLYSGGIVLFKCIKCALKHTAQKQKFHLISWCINFLERHSFRRVSGYLPEILRKLCLSIIFSNQEIRWNFGISLSDSDRKEVTGDRNSFIFAPNIPQNLATWITMMMFYFSAWEERGGGRCEGEKRPHLWNILFFNFLVTHPNFMKFGDLKFIWD